MSMAFSQSESSSARSTGQQQHKKIVHNRRQSFSQIKPRLYELPGILTPTTVARIPRETVNAARKALNADALRTIHRFPDAEKIFRGEHIPNVRVMANEDGHGAMAAYVAINELARSKESSSTKKRANFNVPTTLKKVYQWNNVTPYMPQYMTDSSNYSVADIVYWRPTASATLKMKLVHEELAKAKLERAILAEHFKNKGVYLPNNALEAREGIRVLYSMHEEIEKEKAWEKHMRKERKRAILNAKSVVQEMRPMRFGPATANTVVDGGNDLFVNGPERWPAAPPPKPVPPASRTRKMPLLSPCRLPPRTLLSVSKEGNGNGYTGYFYSAR